METTQTFGMCLPTYDNDGNVTFKDVGTLLKIDECTFMPDGRCEFMCVYMHLCMCLCVYVNALCMYTCMCAFVCTFIPDIVGVYVCVYMHRSA
jgi:hypothetical protein